MHNIKYKHLMSYRN